MIGGSISSDAVVSLVKEGTWGNLDTQFDNKFGGARKKRPGKKSIARTKTVSPTKPKPKSVAKKGGSGCFICGGNLQQRKGCSLHGGMKRLEEYDEDEKFGLFNKKGGADPLFQVKYDYADAMTQGQHGVHINRAVDLSSVQFMANDSPSTMGAVHKTVQYGNVFDSTNIPFSYGLNSGGALVKKLQPKKAASKKATQSKPKSQGKKTKTNTKTKTKPKSQK